MRIKTLAHVKRVSLSDDQRVWLESTAESFGIDQAKLIREAIDNLRSRKKYRKG